MNLIIDQLNAVSGPANVPVYLDVVIPQNGKYVIESTGSPAEIGLWGAFPPGITSVDGPPYGKIRVCGSNARSCGMLLPGRYLMRVKPTVDGNSVFIKVRKWTFLDYFTIGSYKSSC